MYLKNFLQTGERSRPVVVAPSIRLEEQTFWPQANHEILWGWKRDVGINSRTVYFSGKLALGSAGCEVRNCFFFYKHRTAQANALLLFRELKLAGPGLSQLVCEPRMVLERSGDDPLATIYFKIGVPPAKDLDRVTRLVLRKPRKNIGTTILPIESDFSRILPLFPADLYAGSGVSYEAGLPTLCQVHDYFCLDNHEAETFTYGEADCLPRWLQQRPLEVFIDFCRVHTMALVAKPTVAQQVISQLFRDGMFRRVFTDNVDNLFGKTNVQFTRTRGSGVFNERFSAKFRTKSLLVVGVAADRRQLIRQARGKRMNIIVVDPCASVSHGVQHLNFLRPTDHFFRMTAHEFFGTLGKLLKQEKAVA